ncbi:MAG TPA: 30S ribosomal protein S9 [Patescibacteria group bacterium]|nr:30S ribosomal protein S9 [Patescibacteria group bacterium]
MDEKKIITSGKRKSAVARAIIHEGNGDVRINKKNYKSLPFFEKLRMEEPIRIAKEVLGKTNFDVLIEVRGGGEKGQIEAARLALARAISEFSKSKELTEVLDNYDRNLLVADIRRKETRKPNDSKARAKRQASKR